MSGCGHMAYVGPWTGVPEPDGGDITIPEFKPITGEAQNTVANRFSSAESYAAAAFIAARELLAQLGNVDSQFSIDEPDAADFAIGDGPGADSVEPRPTIGEIQMGDVAEIPDPILEDLPGVNIEDIPPFIITSPTPNIPDAPIVTWPILNATEPVDRDINIPDDPGIVLPPVPQLSDINIPPAPELNIPQFDAAEPLDDLTPPDAMFVYHETPYYSELLNQLSS